MVISNDYIWDIQSGITFTGLDSNTVYKTRKEALKVCSLSSSCTVVTRESDNVFRTRTGTKPRSDVHKTSYIQGAEIVMHEKRYFTKLSNMKLGEPDTSRGYNSESVAARECVKHKKCSGFVLHGGKYYTTTTWQLYTKEKYTSFVLNDEKMNYVSYSTVGQNEYWYVSSPYVHKDLYGGWISNRRDAFKQCIRDRTCKGVSYIEKQRRWRRAKSTKLVVAEGVAYNRKGKLDVDSGYIWQVVIGAKISGDFLDGSTYAREPLALDACAAKPACTGVTMVSKRKYRLNKKTDIIAAKGQKAYLKGSGAVQFNNVAWPKIPGQNIKERYGGWEYKTYSQAMGACLQRVSQCSGVNMVAPHKYQLAKGNTMKVSEHGAVFIRGGNYVALPRIGKSDIFHLVHCFRSNVFDNNQC